VVFEPLSQSNVVLPTLTVIKSSLLFILVGHRSSETAKNCLLDFNTPAWPKRNKKSHTLIFCWTVSFTADVHCGGGGGFLSPRVAWTSPYGLVWMKESDLCKMFCCTFSLGLRSGIHVWKWRAVSLKHSFTRCARWVQASSPWNMPISSGGKKIHWCPRRDQLKQHKIITLPPQASQALLRVR